MKGKSNEIDLVTEADVASETLIRAALSQSHPEIGFWGEESDQAPETEFFWVVDPIDGTVNYANQLPFFSITIALNQYETTRLGVTVELPSRRIFWAKLGDGAFVRTVDSVDTRLCVNDSSRLRTSVFSTGFPYHRADSTDNNSAEFAYFMPRCQGIRCLGSSALDLAHVAEGHLAGYWEAWVKAWDAAAGSLFVREAGGCVTDYSGKPWNVYSHSLVSSNGQEALHTAMLEGIREARSGLTESMLQSEG
ncbi:MAG: inositol monophosphatase [Caldilineaceae bacterium]|nr:inositol monophosphatase [Caldilineaceae bacterium]